MKFNSLIPELSVSDIEKIKQFYINIGFKVIYEIKENKFCFMQLDNNQIMIEEINNNWNTGKLEYPFGRGINISMIVKNVENYYCSLRKKNIVFFKEIMVNTYKVDDETYEDTEFLLQDPDGYLLRFNN